MPKKANKTPKIAILSDSDDEDDFKKPKKKGHKIAISESDDDDDFSLSSPKPSTSKGKINLLFMAMLSWEFAVIMSLIRILRFVKRRKGFK